MGFFAPADFRGETRSCRKMSRFVRGKYFFASAGVRHRARCLRLIVIACFYMNTHVGYVCCSARTFSCTACHFGSRRFSLTAAISPDAPRPRERRPLGRKSPAVGVSPLYTIVYGGRTRSHWSTLRTKGLGRISRLCAAAACHSGMGTAVYNRKQLSCQSRGGRQHRRL